MQTYFRIALTLFILSISLDSVVNVFSFINKHLKWED